MFSYASAIKLPNYNRLDMDMPAVFIPWSSPECHSKWDKKFGFFIAILTVPQYGAGSQCTDIQTEGLRSWKSFKKGSGTGRPFGAEQEEEDAADTWLRAL